MVLSPLETVKAFIALMLYNHDSDAPIESLLKEVGQRPFLCGFVP